MVKSKELRNFYTISWKIKSVASVFTQIKYEISKIWAGIPYASRKKLGLERVNKTFDKINNNVRTVINDLNTISYLYNKVYKNVILTLQSAGVFFGNQWVEDSIKVRVEEFQTITDNANLIVKNIAAALNVESNINYGIDNPNIIDLFAINQARVNVAIKIVEECKKFLASVLNQTKEADANANNETIELIRTCVNNINQSFDDIIGTLEVINSFFDELTVDIINTLRSVYIDIETKPARKDEIYRVIAYSDIADVYRMLRGSLKYGNAFNKLLQNQNNTHLPKNNFDTSSKNKDINDISESVIVKSDIFNLTNQVTKYSSEESSNSNLEINKELDTSLEKIAVEK